MIISNRTERLSMFVLAGWLFADLFIGLALLFMVGNTQPVPVRQSTSISPRSIDPKDYDMKLVVNDPSSVINQDPVSVHQLLSQIDEILSENGDSGKRVGIVLVYSGSSDALAHAVITNLPFAGPSFKEAIFRQYFNTEQTYSYLELDIFFYTCPQGACGQGVA